MKGYSLDPISKRREHELGMDMARRVCWRNQNTSLAESSTEADAFCIFFILDSIHQPSLYQNEHNKLSNQIFGSKVPSPNYFKNNATSCPNTPSKYPSISFNTPSTRAEPYSTSDHVYYKWVYDSGYSCKWEQNQWIRG